MKTDELIKCEKVNIFVKIKNILKKLFLREKEVKNNTNKNTKEVQNEFINRISLNNNEISAEFSNKKYKKEFFKYYNDFKSKKISLEEIPFPILLKINKMLDEELKIKAEINNEIEQSIINNDMKI